MAGWLSFTERCFGCNTNGRAHFRFGWSTLGDTIINLFYLVQFLTKAFSKRKAALAEKFSKGGQRDWGQVLANGGLGAILALGYYLWHQPEWMWLAFAGAMAAVNADTWSTELGVLSPVLPRLITTGKRVERGTSGGITLTGTLAATGGAALIGLAAIIFAPSSNWLTHLGMIILAGLLGSLFNSMLGATIQAIYWCPNCKKETERHPLHTCGTSTEQVRGWTWVNNDLVNFACSLMGAILACGIWLLLS